MSPYVFTECPSCGNSLRFNRPSAERFVVICPNCQHLFDAGTLQIEQGLVPATLIRRADDVLREHDVLQEMASSPADQPLDDLAVLENLIPSQPIQPVRPIPKSADSANRQSVDNQSTWLARPVPSSRSNRSQAGTIQFSARWLAPVLAVGLLLFILSLGGVALYRNPDLRASLGIGRFRELDLAERYAAAVKNCQEQISDPNLSVASSEFLLRDSLTELEQLLADCVEMATIPEPRHRELRVRLQELFSSQLEFKEQAYRVVPGLTSEHRLQVAKLSSLIGLIDLRLNYGLRELPVGRSELEAYCRDGILRMRQLDHHFLASLREGLEPQVAGIAANLDELDRLALARSRSGGLREPMPYEYRMLASASEAWHQWCMGLSEETATSRVIVRAVRDERADSWDRFQSALTQPNIPALEIAALDRIQQQIQLALPGLQSSSQNSSLMASNSNTLKDSAATQLSALDNHPRREADALGAAPVASRLGLGSSRSLDAGNSEEGLGQIADSTRSTRSSGSSGSKGQPSGNSDFGNSLDYAASPDSPRDSAQATQTETSVEQLSGTPSHGASDRESKAALEFPAPKFSGPKSLCIKVQARSPAQVKVQAEALGQRLKLTPDIQESGNLMTISFDSFSGNPFEIADSLEFGVVEIVDGQSRTLFVVQ